MGVIRGQNPRNRRSSAADSPRIPSPDASERAGASAFGAGCGCRDAAEGLPLIPQVKTDEFDHRGAWRALLNTIERSARGDLETAMGLDEEAAASLGRRLSARLEAWSPGHSAGCMRLRVRTKAPPAKAAHVRIVGGSMTAKRSALTTEERRLRR
jgi:hypothetical protein